MNASLSVKRLIQKSLFAGFLLGVLLFTIAPLGLGFYPIEVLRPVLVPGLLLTQLILGGGISAVHILLAVVLNGLVFSLLVLAILLSRSRKG